MAKIEEEEITPLPHPAPHSLGEGGMRQTYVEGMRGTCTL